MPKYVAIILDDAQYYPEHEVVEVEAGSLAEARDLIAKRMSDGPFQRDRVTVYVFERYERIEL